MSREQRKQSEQPSDAKAIAIIAGALAIGASPQATATSLSAALGIPIAAILPAVVLAMSKPMVYGVAPLSSASALDEAQKLEPSYRAAYVLAASRRIQAASPANRQDVLRREQTYFNQHLAAMQKRREAATQVDSTAKAFGDTLGWHAKMDSITSEECREANGKNFSASRLPAIGWPGSVHPNCRCKAGRKFATSETVYSVKPKEHAA